MQGMPGRMQGASTVFACDHEMHPKLRRKTATRRSVRSTRGVRERAMLPIKRRRVVVALDKVLPNLRPDTLEHVPEVSEHLRRRITHLSDVPMPAVGLPGLGYAMPAPTQAQVYREVAPNGLSVLVYVLQSSVPVPAHRC